MRTSSLSSPSLIKFSHSENEDGKEIYLFDSFGSSVVDESKDSSPPSLASGELGI